MPPIRVAFLRAVLSCCALFAASSHAQTFTLPKSVTTPPLSTCTDAAQVPITPGSTPFIPGRWWNPKRTGTGWDFIVNNGNQSMTVVWFAYDAQGRPTWLIANANNIQFDAVNGSTWSSRLLQYTWRTSSQDPPLDPARPTLMYPPGNNSGAWFYSYGPDYFSPTFEKHVGNIAVRMMPNDPTRAAVTWSWLAVDNSVGSQQQYTECLQEIAHSNDLGGVTAGRVNQSYSGFYQDPNTGFWGASVSIAQIVEGQNGQSKYAEMLALAIYDVSGYPAWVQHLSGARNGTPDTWSNAATFLYSTPVSNSPMRVITDCVNGGGVVCTNSVSAGNGQRDYLTPTEMQLNLSIKTQNNIGGRTPIDWNTSGEVGFTKLTQSDMIVADRLTCRIEYGQEFCSVTVNWTSTYPAANVFRYDLDANRAQSLVELGASTSAPYGEFVDTLRVGQRVVYQLKLGSAEYYGTVSATPEIRALTAEGKSAFIADVPPAPYSENVPQQSTSLTEVGATPGTASVSPGGGASYSMPIFTSPGTASYRPQLALTYASGGSGSAVGKGWSIAGLSSVTRCRKTREAGDGLGPHGPITLDSNDVYCMGGARLIQHTGTASCPTPYLATAIAREYRPDNSPTTRVCEYGTNGTPSFFVSYSADGQVTEFGTSADSKLDVIPRGASSSVPLSWAITQSLDASGNKIRYEYIESTPVANRLPGPGTEPPEYDPADPSQGEQVLKRVRYAYGATTANAAEIRFYYDEVVGLPVTARSRGYVAGSRLDQYLKMTGISVFADGMTSNNDMAVALQEVRRYNLAQSTMPSGFMRLDSVTECVPQSQPTITNTDQQPTATLVCLGPTSFTYTGGSGGFQNFVIADGAGSSLSAEFDLMVDHKIGDLNGDGRQDLVFITSSYKYGDMDPLPPGTRPIDTLDPDVYRMYVSVGTSTGLAAPQEITLFHTLGMDSANSRQAESTAHLWYLYDFTADGRDDLLLFRQKPPTVQGGRIQVPDAGLDTGWQVFKTTCSGGNCQFAGKSGTGVATVGYQPTPDLQCPSGVDGNCVLADYASRSKFSDVTGDGLPDLMYRRDGALFLRQMQFGAAVEGRYYKLSSTEYSVSFSGGPSGTIDFNLDRGIGTDIADFNGDGLVDFTAIVTGASTKTMELYASSGIVGTTLSLIHAGTFGKTGYPAFNATDPDNSIVDTQFADINGDGLTDALFKRWTSGTTGTSRRFTWAYGLNTGKAASNGSVLTALKTVGGDANRENLTLFDVNGDGRLDAVYRSESSTYSCGSQSKEWRTKARIWTLNGFGSSTEIVGSGAVGNWGSALDTEIYIDHDGDGDPDLLHIAQVGPYQTNPNGGPCFYSGGLHLYRAANTSARSELLFDVTDGLSQRVEFEYAPSTETSIYRRSFDAVTKTGFGRGSPVFDYFGAMPLVKRIKRFEPNTLDYTSTRYLYEFGRVQSGGRGFLGFEFVHAMDEQRQLINSTQYQQNAPYVGWAKAGVARSMALPADVCPSHDAVGCLAESTCTTGACTTTSISDAWTTATSVSRFSSTPTSIPAFSAVAQQPITIVESSRQQAGYELTTGGLESCTRTSSTYDATFGLLESKTSNVYTADCFSAVPTSSYRQATIAEDPTYQSPTAGANWFVGRITRMTQTATRYNVGSDGFITPVSNVRTTDFEYDTKGRLNSIIQEPNGSANEYLRTALRLNALGVIVREAQCSNHANTFTACDNLSGYVFTPTVQANTYVHRFRDYAYDDRGRFVMTTKSPFASATSGSATETVATRDALGLPTSSLDGNGVQTTMAYTRFGRPRFNIRSTGEFSKQTYTKCTGTTDCPEKGAFYVFNDATGNTGTSAAPKTWVYFDVYGRELLKVTEAFRPAGAAVQYSAVARGYDATGNLAFVTEPYASQSMSPPGLPKNGQPVASQPKHQFLYDDVDRLESRSLTVANEATSIDYGVRSSTVTNARGKETTTHRNALGEVVKSLDAASFLIDYRYHPTGKIDQVTRTPNDGASGNRLLTTSAGYDKLGRRTSLTDSDKGSWSYVFNPVGELIAQTDAKGQVTTLRYDGLGRLVSRTEVKTGTTTVTTSWTFDSAIRATTSGYALGRLKSVTTNDGYRRDHAYDKYGRLSDTYTLVDGVWYAEKVTYDQYGRIFQSFDAARHANYAAGSPPAKVHFAYGTRFNYAANGYLESKREAYPAGVGTVYWEARETDARGQLTRERHLGRSDLETVTAYDAATGRMVSRSTGASGTYQRRSYRFDKNGNLICRDEDGFTCQSGPSTYAFSETYAYDDLDRLVNEKYNALATDEGASNSYRYDQLGNMLKRRGSTLTSANLASEAKCSTVSGSRVPGPHALNRWVNASLGVDSQFCYDANGNQIAERGTSNSTTRDITYTGFDLPSRIVRSEYPQGGSLLNATMDLAYSPERARIKRTETVNNVKTTTWTVGGVEFIARSGATKPSETKRYLGNVIAIRKANTYGAITNSLEVLLTDHIGSVDVVLPVTNGVVGAPVRMSFDAFGQRRTNATTTLSMWAQATYDLNRSTRGYTGHEQLDSVGLVHMNGRIYDPRTARFVQADPIIADLFDSQSFNRYSYVMNRPLSLTDPTGFVADDDKPPTPLPEVPVRGFLPNEAGVIGNGYLARLVYEMWAGQSRQLELTARGQIAFQNRNGWTAWATNLVAPTATDLFLNPAHIANDATLLDDLAGAGEGYLELLQGSMELGILAPSVFVLDMAGVERPSAPNLTDKGQNGKAAFEIVSVAYGAYKWIASSGPLRLANGPKPSSGPWKPGDSPHALTRNGNTPSIRTVTRREWKNEARAPTRSDFTAADIARMRRGQAPQRYNPDKGGIESMERSHEPVPRRDGGTLTVPRWPQEHAAVDPFRRPGY